MLEYVVALLGLVVASAVAIVIGFVVRKTLERDREKVASRLRVAVNTASESISATGVGSEPVGVLEAQVEGAARERSLSAQQRVDDDRFAELLVQRYAYGLTQSQRSFITSQVFSALGGAVLLLGVGLAIWRAETHGNLDASIVTTSAGVVTTVIGRLFHRESDKALNHMASETDGLRDDMRAERSTEQAISLLSEVNDPKIKARLQAGLIMRFAGSEMPMVHNDQVSS
ncbi:hypothetical protein OG709_00695 [Streptomyces sp. NBC_01267]|uniref:TRADD-N-associated membrane domain-containing protein n=1 Tax=unclassified Streptomyces TaxID=2593676 RepID=UPI002E2EDB7D|nr:hypothetical protein [Streptomyces sp. NBC_01267]WSV58327.1 hypothetical protein OG282_34205 [Streptomyces sp. NBC_01014]